MSIEQKALEIAESVSDNWEVEHKGLEFAIAKHAARLGIIEGLEMAIEMVEQYPSPLDDLPMGMAMWNVAKAIRALIEEQKV